MCLSYFKDTIIVTQSSFPVQILNKVKDSLISCFTPTSVEEVKQIMKYSLHNRCDLDPLPTTLLIRIDSLLSTISNMINYH